MPNAFDAHADARTGITSPFGKLDETVKTHIDEHTATLFMRKANSLEQVPGELLRDLIYLCVHGQTHLELMAKHRRDLLEQQGPNEGLGRIRP